MTEQTFESSGLLDRIQQGDQGALGDLFSEYRDRLRRMVEFRLDTRLRGRVSPSDVLQEAYIDTLKRFQHYHSDPAVPFFVWLRSVTEQRLIDVHRQHLGAQARSVAREVSLGVGQTLEASSDAMATLVGDQSSPSGAARRQELVDRVRDALDHLEPLDREVLALRHFEELSNRETAAVLGIQTPAASKRYVRALERLKAALESWLSDEEASQ
jgi:RNA polymerase sigma-70 factor (ECF subfamily)